MEGFYNRDCTRVAALVKFKHSSGPTLILIRVWPSCQTPRLAGKRFTLDRLRSNCWNRSRTELVIHLSLSVTSKANIRLTCRNPGVASENLLICQMSISTIFVTLLRPAVWPLVKNFPSLESCLAKVSLKRQRVTRTLQLRLHSKLLTRIHRISPLTLNGKKLVATCANCVR